MADEQKQGSQNSGDMAKGRMCNCGCGCGWVHGHRIFRIVLALIVLALVFAFGVKIGEFHSARFGGRGFYGRTMRPMMMFNGTGGAGPMMVPQNGSTTAPLR